MIFLNVNMPTNSFCIKECLCTQNVKYNSEALLLGYNQVFFHPDVLGFLPIYFPHMLSISGKPHLFSWERFDSSIFLCTSNGQKSRVEVSSCSCHLK